MKNNYNEVKGICRCPVCGNRVSAQSRNTGHYMEGTHYYYGGCDEQFIARLDCGHLVQVNLYHTGNKVRDGVAVSLGEFEGCRV
jgi:hypothetical protein